MTSNGVLHKKEENLEKCSKEITNMEITKVQVYSNKQLLNVKSEFSRLKGECYLDHAGATLYSEKQLEHVFLDLSSNIYANPHARNTSSQSTGDAVDIIRYQILSYFNTTQEQYSVIFTSGATHALKLIAETFEFNGGTLAYLEDNHTSVLGMRNFATNFREVKVAEAFNILSQEFQSENSQRNGENSIFVYPAQSNFAGTKYPLSWIETVRQGGLERLTNKPQRWFTLLDAAAFVPTSHLALNKYKPDFVAISFYKIFGYPTGLGALLVKKSSEEVLRKQYFGGGTVLMALSSENVMIPRPHIYERFEDGTIPFLSILAIKHGFDSFKRFHLTPQMISQHTFNLAKYTFESMAELHHVNGEPVAIIYHDTGYKNESIQGGIVNFNLKRPDGEYVGYAEVLHIANLHEIYLRTGCFCNPGACQKFLKLGPNDVIKHFEAGHVCGDQHDLVDGYPTGTVRISFGYMSTYEDADKFLQMIEKCFVLHPLVRKKRKSGQDVNLRISNGVNQYKEDRINNNISKLVSEDLAKLDSKENGTNGFKSPDVEINEKKVFGKLTKIFLYPVKSCGAYSAKGSWELTNIGLKYDRRWMIVNAAGSCVSQKQIKKLCTLKPVLDFNKNKLILSLSGAKEISTSLEPPEEETKDAYFCDSKVCGDKIQGYDCGDAIADWLSTNLERPGLRLLRQCDFSETISGRNSKQGEQTMLSLANVAQYLLINLASVRWVRERIPKEDASWLTEDSIISRFRANFVVDFEIPFVEKELDIFGFNNVMFKFLGNCTRCQMICVDQETGDTSKEPLQTLSRELKGKMCFGVYLSQHNVVEENVVKIGCTVAANFQQMH